MIVVSKTKKAVWNSGESRRNEKLSCVVSGHVREYFKCDLLNVCVCESG